MPETELSRILRYVEIFMVKSFRIGSAIQDSKLNLPLTSAKALVERNIQIEKTFRQACPEVVMASDAGEKSFLLLIHILANLKLFKEAMLAIADCLVSTAPTAGVIINTFSII